MKKIAFVLTSLTVAALLLSGCAKKASNEGGLTIEKGILKVGAEVGYPPFEYPDENANPVGFDVDLANEIAKRLGLEKAVIIDTAWDGILAGLDTAKYDVIMSAMTITPERQAHYDFSVPYIGNGQCIVLNKEKAFRASFPDDLEGKQVGYQDETTSDIFINKYAKEHNMKIVPAEYDQVLNAMEDLRLGRIDAVCADSLVAVDYLNKPGNPYMVAWQGTPDEYFGVAMKKGSTELLEKVNQAIRDIAADGTMLKISEKIFGADMVSSAYDKQK